MSLVGVLCFCGLVGSLSGSAIPMWEYLSKQEKTSYIYSLFAHQVEELCEKSSIPDCNRRLLKYGLGTLKGLDETSLDLMDPYQRDANNIIWESLMRGHALQRTTPRPHLKSTSTAKPNSYEDNSFSDYVDGSETARIDNVYIVAPPKDFLLRVDVGNQQYTDTQPSNQQYTSSNTFRKQQGVYSRFQHNFQPIRVTTEKVQVSSSTTSRNDEHLDSIILEDVYESQDTVGKTEKIPTEEEDGFLPLTGPMEVKVYPDGRPVAGQSRSLPQDEDLRQYRLSKIALPKL